MSLDKAIEIANSSECVVEGQLKETSMCNASTGTWWIDIESEKQGCNPACVINVETETAEINWRCTGLVETKEKIGPVVEKIIFKPITPENALESINSGEIDYYLGSIKVDEKIEQMNTVELVKAYSIMQGLLLNPAPSTENNFNPFSSQKARFAMQFLIDRDSVVENVHSGFGNGASLNIFKNHSMYEKSLEVVEKLSIEFDPTKGKELLSEAMLEQGAEKVDGKWQFNGQVISLKVNNIDYIEEMKEIGDITAKILEDAGFEVEITYLARGEDNLAYNSDPADLEWNITPVSWIYYGQNRYVVPSFPELYEKEDWWVYENSEKKLLEKQLEEESFTDSEKWEELVWNLTQVNLEDSVGIWVSQQQNLFAKNQVLQNTTEDNFVGLRNYLNVRKAEIPGNDTIKIGMSETYRAEDSWNPLVIMGINMMDITNTIHDPGIWSNPKTLKKEAFRLNFEIESEEGTEISVPEDSFIWNVEEKKWSTVAEGTTAKTKVSYNLSNYLGAKWHHGVEIGWSDILFFTASLWDRSFDKEKLATDDFGTWMQDVFNETAGIRINGNILEVYLNKSSFETDQLTGFAGTFQRLAPWEIYAGADELVFENKTFNYSEDSSKDTKPLSLVNEEHVLELINTLKAMDFQKIKPLIEVAGKEYATEEEFNARIIALKNWFDEKGHLIISDGPFYLNKYNSVTGELELNAFRDESYPIKWKQWNK